MVLGTRCYVKKGFGPIVIWYCYVLEFVKPRLSSPAVQQCAHGLFLGKKLPRIETLIDKWLNIFSSICFSVYLIFRKIVLAILFKS